MGSADNDENEILDIIVAEDGIEIEDNQNIIEEAYKEGLELVETNKATSDDDK